MSPAREKVAILSMRKEDWEKKFPGEKAAYEEQDVPCSNCGHICSVTKTLLQTTGYPLNAKVLCTVCRPPNKSDEELMHKVTQKLIALNNHSGPCILVDFYYHLGHKGLCVNCSDALGAIQDQIYGINQGN